MPNVNRVSNNHTQQLEPAAEQPSTANQLREAITQANAHVDLVERMRVVDAHLEDPNISSAFGGYELANLHWNAAIDHTKLSDRYFRGRATDDSRCQLVPAFRHQDSALEHIRKASGLYSSNADRALAERMTNDILASRNYLLSCLEGVAAALPDYRPANPPSRPLAQNGPPERRRR